MPAETPNSWQCYVVCARTSLGLHTSRVYDVGPGKKWRRWRDLEPGALQYNDVMGGWELKLPDGNNFQFYDYEDDCLRGVAPRLTFVYEVGVDTPDPRVRRCGYKLIDGVLVRKY